VATFSLALRHHQESVRAAKLLAKIAREVDVGTPMRLSSSKLPGDVDGLRGVPFVGVRNGRGGAIRGSRPDRRF